MSVVKFLTLLAIIWLAAVTVLSGSNATMPFCEVIYHALLTDNKHAKREQSCSGYDNSRPGNIFHPDFLLGRLGFFDVTVANSLQPSFITKAVSNAGAAAEACKDFRHADRVTAAGGIFYPLCFENSGHHTVSRSYAL